MSNEPNRPAGPPAADGSPPSHDAAPGSGSAADSEVGAGEVGAGEAPPAWPDAASGPDDGSSSGGGGEGGGDTPSDAAGGEPVTPIADATSTVTGAGTAGDAAAGEAGDKPAGEGESSASEAAATVAAESGTPDLARAGTAPVEPAAGATGVTDLSKEPPGAAQQRPAGVGAEQIEWQPVATGDQIEWQPVVSAEGESGGEGGWQEPVTYEGDEGDEGWDPDPGATSGGNGAAGPYAKGRGAHPAQRRPAATRRPPAKHRPPPRTPAPARRPDDLGDGSAGLPSKARRQIILLSVATVAVLVVFVSAFMISRGAKDAGTGASGDGVATPTTARAGPTIAADQMQQVRDPLTNFVIKVPKAWTNFVPPVSDIRLVMEAGENDGLRIRVLPIQTPATVDNIGNFKEVTDAIVFGDQTAKLIQEQLIRVNGLLAYHYIYTFKDKATGLEGVHAHYFVFEGNRMFSIVFQTLPTEDFRRLAPVFDQVAESFTVGPAPTTTSTP